MKSFVRNAQEDGFDLVKLRIKGLFIKKENLYILITKQIFRSI